MLQLHPIFPFPLLLLPFMLSLLSYPQSEAASSDSGYQRCKEPYKYWCGRKEYNISYPFLAYDEWEGCGHPDYLLKCSSEDDDGNLTISINEKDFNVLNINYTSEILTVALQDINLFDESTCKIKNDRGNTSIDAALFHFTPPDINLTLLNCPSASLPPSPLPNISKISCTTGNPLPLYLVSGPPPTHIAAWKAGCTLTTLVIKGPPVYDPLSLTTPELLQDALRKGFDIKWTAGDEWCALCLQSRGMCGYNRNNIQELTCYCPDGTTGVGSCPKHKGLGTARKIVIGFAVLVLGIIILCGFVFFAWYRKRRLEKRNSSMTSSFFKSVTPSTSSFGFGGGDEESPGAGYYKTPMFTYEELEEATGGFSHELGDGGFGTVYKGKLKDGRVVAIKCLHQNTCRRVQQFRNEIEILNRLRHQNLVTLYGCSNRDSPKLLLVYEFVPNGTIADHLHGHLSTQHALTWALRMSVAIESAAALSYLHAVKPQIIHRDVKTTNILLDSDFHVKVADFGLSRLFPDLGVTHVSTAPQGTPGYVDPEYHQCYQLTDKSDVYSFGVVLVELVSSMPAVDITRNRNEINLSNMAMQKIPAGLVGDLADARLGYGSDSEVTRMVNAVCELAFRCLQQERDMRPSMQEVLDELVRIKGGGDSWGGGKKPGQHDKEKNSSRDDVYLLNIESQTGSSPPFSPNTMNGTSWPSRSTTPNASC